LLAVDSNILLRYLTQDDSAQTPVAVEFVERWLTAETPGYVSVPVLCEVVWSLRRVYGFSTAAVVRAVRGLLDTAQIVVAEEEAVLAALETPEGFTDALIHALGRAAGCSETVTFDRGFARLEGVRLLTA
jgi:predicted nucleic-acid-binding protein